MTFCFAFLHWPLHMIALAYGVGFSEQIIGHVSKNMHYKAACTISVTSQNNLPHFLNHKKRLYSRPSLEENFQFLIKCGRCQSHTRKWAIYFCFSLVEKKQKQGTASKECKLIVWRKLWDELVDKAVFGGTFSSLHLFPWKNPDNSDFQASNTPFSLLY